MKAQQLASQFATDASEISILLHKFNTACSRVYAAQVWSSLKANHAFLGIPCPIIPSNVGDCSTYWKQGQLV